MKIRTDAAAQTRKTIRAATAQARCVARKCAGLAQALPCQAQRSPFMPQTMAQTRPPKGTSQARSPQSVT